MENINTSFSIADYFGNGGFSISGYDVGEINHRIEADLERHVEEYRAKCPEPELDNFDVYDDAEWRYEQAHESWVRDCTWDLENFFDDNWTSGLCWADMIEEHFYPAGFLAEALSLPEEEVADAIRGYELLAEDLDAIVNSIENVTDEPTIRDVKEAVYVNNSGKHDIGEASLATEARAAREAATALDSPSSTDHSEQLRG
ncbi:hypothetical protein BHK98_09145 [Hornefia porci]|uniref:Uncharacterized protein n=1 Tax=Hornefia porci TaxID=2652292 RepID=A0A1Q9JJ32_9FIRM|nr:hypothetical protein [Hornefia porci]OLR56213.1 hypothetical protein BHK98_09145 [Hornefia porci]